MKIVKSLMLAGFLVSTPVMAEGVVDSLLGGGGEKSDGQAIVDQRVEMMKQLGGAMKALSAAAKGDKPMSEVGEAAQLVATIGDKLATMFPEGTAKGDEGIDDSRALPNIWDDKEAFNNLFTAMGEGGQAAVAAVAAEDQAALGAALGQAGKNCKACHDEHRGKKNFLF